MVRLRPECTDEVPCPFYKFQFHYGAIKTVRDLNKNGVFDKFQFHYGAIKT